jgi:hypothetical protein
VTGLPAADYPWAGPVPTGLVGPDGLLGQQLPPPTVLAERVPVVAVGSNASPEVLAGKLAGSLGAGVPISPGVVEGLLVGHSAHVSARGYVAAAPARQASVSASVAVCWFDADQLAAVDATEPNYVRRPLPADLPCRLPDATVVPHAQVYDSVHGVLGEHGAVLALRDQAEVLEWLAARLPEPTAYGLGGPRHQPAAHERLADPEVRERIRADLLELGLSVDSGLR